MTSVMNIQGITNICLFYNLNFGHVEFTKPKLEPKIQIFYIQI